jgi:UPF0042 nucleotide-binding protein
VVRDYVTGSERYGPYLERLKALLDVSLPGYVAEGKSYLTIAIGCTGGHHRSIVVAEELAAWIRARGLPTVLVHRDVDRG